MTLFHKVVDLDASLEAAWTDFVARHSAGLLYYSLRYRDFLLDITGARACYRLALRDDAVVGVMPVMELNGPFGKVLNALPFFGSHGSPLADDSLVRAALIADWTKMTGARDVAAATMIANPLDPGCVDGVPFDAEDHRNGQFTNLPAGDEAESALFDALDGTERHLANRRLYDVMYARKAAVTVREDPTALAWLEAAHRANMAEIGGLAKPHAYFVATAARFRYGDDWRLYVADYNGKPVAAVLLFYFNRTVEYFTPAVADEGRKLQATALILYEAMIAAARQGYERWNWGGTWPDQDGVFRFKRKWGAQVLPYRYCVQIRNPAVLRASRSELLAAYPWFYVVPFGLLDKAADHARNGKNE